MMRWIGRFVALLLALVLGVAEPAAARASGMAMTPCVSSHYVYDGTANNSPPTTEFAAVSAGSRASRVEHAVSATKDLSRLAAVFVAAEDGTMAGVRATDQEGETLAGIDQGAKVRIPSATGAAAYRIPDALTDTTLTEVKNVGSLSYTSQLQDFMSYASSTGPRVRSGGARQHDAVGGVAASGGLRSDQLVADTSTEVTGTPAGLGDDLRDVGVEVEDVWDLVNSKVSYRAAIPVLVDWLRNLDARVVSADQPKLREALVRALSVPAARPAATQPLIEEFRRVDASVDPTGTGLRWTIGNALQVLFDDASFEALAELAGDRRYGKARQMVVLGLGKSKRPEAVEVLLDLVDDPDVDGHAVKALGKLKAPAARAALQAKLDDKRAWVRGEARKALAKLPG